MTLSRQPQSPMSSASLNESLSHLRANPQMRHDFIRALVALEPALQKGSRLNIREKITGPFVDALYQHGEIVEKSIASGLVFACGYTSKIIRDFVMSADETPDHVYEPQNTRLMLDLARIARHIVIGGAFIGDHAIPAAKALGANGMVHAFEVSETNIDLLRRNCAANGITNIAVNECALWSGNTARIALKGEDSHASPYELDAASGLEGIPATSISLYAKEKGLASVDVILLDIEGGEIEALKGAATLLSQPAETAPTVIFEVHASYVDWSNGLDQAEVVRFLAGHGYRAYALRDYNSNEHMADYPIELVDLDGIYLEGPPHGFNMVAFKNPKLIEQRGYRVRKGVSPKLLKHGDPAFHAPIKG